MSHAWKCPECLWMNSAATIKCGRCAHNWERHRTIGETVIYCCRNCPQTAREEVADGAE